MPLAENIFPSFSASKLNFTPPGSFQALNPSIVRISDRFAILQRTVRYGQVPTITRNFWMDIDHNFVTQRIREILPDETYLSRARNDCLGLEDIRPFQLNDEMWGISSAREFNYKGWWSEIILNEFLFEDPDHVYIHKPFVVPPVFGSPRNEKNWMVHVTKEGPLFVYSVSPLVVVDRNGKIIVETEQNIPADTIRGGTQMLPFCDGWLSFVHQVFFENGESFMGIEHYISRRIIGTLE